MNCILFTVLFHAALILLPVLFVAREQKVGTGSRGILKILKELGFVSTGLKPLLVKIVVLVFWLLAASFAVGAIVYFISYSDLEKVQQAFEGVTLLQITYLFIVGGIAEEVFFRGFLVPRAGIIWSSLVFGAFHAAYGSVIEVLSAVVLGLVLAYFFKKNKTIYPNIFAHQAFNFLMFLFFV